MPSKIKNAIASGDVNVGFSAALRNPPVPEEKLVATLEYDDIGPRANVGGYQFYRGTIPYLGRITDILQANNVRLGHTDSNNENVEAILNKRVRGETLRWEINSSNYIDWIVSSAVRARNDEHEFNITLKENGITNITTQGNNSHQFVDFKFYAVELVPDVTPPVPGQFGVFRWQSADYVNPQGAVNPGDIELSSNNREVDHLTNDNVEDVDVIGIEYENGTDLAQFVNSLNVGSALIIYRDNQNVVKYNITASAPNRPAGANLFVRLDVSYADHHLGADGLDATGVDIPVHLGKLAGLSGSSGGGGELNTQVAFLESDLAIGDSSWVEILSLNFSRNGASNSTLKIDASFDILGIAAGEAAPIAARLRAGNNVIRQFAGPDGLVDASAFAGDIRGLPLRMRTFTKKTGTLALDVWTTAARLLYLNTGQIFRAYDGSPPYRRLAGQDINLPTIGLGGAFSNYNFGFMGVAAGNGILWTLSRPQRRSTSDPTVNAHLFAWDLSTFARVRSRDVDTGQDFGINADIAIQGDTLWVARTNYSTIEAWDISGSGAPSRDSSRDISFRPLGRAGLAVAGNQLFIMSRTSSSSRIVNITAWDISNNTPVRDSSSDINSISGNNIGGITYVWTDIMSDGTYIWLAGIRQFDSPSPEDPPPTRLIWCYNIVSGDRESSRDISSGAGGIASAFGAAVDPRLAGKGSFLEATEL